MSTWSPKRDAQHYLAGQTLPVGMQAKAQLARELGLSRDRFRLLLRKIEVSVPGFFTGSKRCLTPAQQVVVRQFLSEQLNGYNLQVGL